MDDSTDTNAPKIEIPVGLVGCDFRRGSSSWRSCLVLSREERRQMSQDLFRRGIVEGLVFLDTCNRNEWLFAAANPAWAAEILKAQMIKRWQHRTGRRPQPYAYVSGEAVQHILRVAAGMESAVVGERQILSQLSRWWAIGVQRNAEDRIVVNRAFVTFFDLVRIDGRLNFRRQRGILL